MKTEKEIMDKIRDLEIEFKKLRQTGSDKRELSKIRIILTALGWVIS